MALSFQILFMIQIWRNLIDEYQKGHMINQEKINTLLDRNEKLELYLIKIFIKIEIIFSFWKNKKKKLSKRERDARASNIFQFLSQKDLQSATFNYFWKIMWSCFILILLKFHLWTEIIQQYIYIGIIYFKDFDWQASDAKFSH